MSLMDLYRVLKDDEIIEIAQDDNDGSYISIQCKPDSIPVHLLECYVKEVRKGKDLIIIELCS